MKYHRQLFVRNQGIYPPYLGMVNIGALRPCAQETLPLFELFFVKKYLLVGAWGVLWVGGSVDQ